MNNPNYLARTSRRSAFPRRSKSVVSSTSASGRKTRPPQVVEGYRAETERVFRNLAAVSRRPARVSITCARRRVSHEHE